MTFAPWLLVLLYWGIMGFGNLWSCFLRRVMLQEVDKYDRPIPNLSYIFGTTMSAFLAPVGILVCVAIKLAGWLDKNWK